MGGGGGGCEGEGKKAEWITNWNYRISTLHAWVLDIIVVFVHVVCGCH